MTRSNSPTNLQIMRVLIAKDWRFFRLPMLALLVSVVACYAVVILAQWYTRSTDMRQQIMQAIEAASAFGLMIVGLFSCVFGAMAIAGERNDRTADFMGLLPVTRWQIILSKWVVSLLMLGTCAGFHLLVALALSMHDLLHTTLDEPQQIFYAVAIVSGFTFSLFGVAWMLGTFLRSGPNSACLSIAFTLCTTVFIVLVMEGHQYTPQKVQLLLSLISATMGFLGVIVGTIYYLRRIAP